VLAELWCLECAGRVPVLQELYAGAAHSEEGTRALLHHVLLWQYLKRRNVMPLVELALAQEVQPAPHADTTFLSTVGAPLVRWAIQQVRRSAQAGFCAGACALHACPRRR
jgi:hypothetical protein